MGTELGRIVTSLGIVLVGAAAHALDDGPWGCDASLAYEHREGSPSRPRSLGAWVVRGVVSFHQMLLSEAEASRSHFRPSSSQYMLLAVQKYGVFAGVLAGMDRLMRENDERWVYPHLPISKTAWIKWDPP